MSPPALINVHVHAMRPCVFGMAMPFAHVFLAWPFVLTMCFWHGPCFLLKFQKVFTVGSIFSLASPRVMLLKYEMIKDKHDPCRCDKNHVSNVVLCYDDNATMTWVMSSCFLPWNDRFIFSSCSKAPCLQVPSSMLQAPRSIMPAK